MSDHFDELTAGAVAAHSTATVSGEWDADAQVRKLDSPMTMSTARAMYAWIDTSAAEDGDIPKSACKFSHHMVSADGSPGAANLTACSAGIAALNGARGGANIPSNERRGVYNHLRKHLIDGGREADSVPELRASADMEQETLTAAVHVVTIPDVPPAEWFDPPTDVEIGGAITVTDEGRIYGLIGPAGTNHRGKPGANVKIPMGNVNYNRFLQGETITASGSRVITGPLTMNCGHSRNASDMDHYDNTCSIVATVAVGEWDGVGVWMSGALVPGTTPSTLVKLMSSAVSGEWRKSLDRPGEIEFMQARVVPTPAFAMEREPTSLNASAETEEGSIMVATPVEFIRTEQGCGCTDTAINQSADVEPDLTAAAQLIARTIGRDVQSRIEHLRTVVHGCDKEVQSV